MIFRFRNSPAGYFVGGVACLGLLVYALATGELPMRRSAAILRTATPQQFWIGVAILCAGVVGCFAWAIRLMGRDSQ
jgi:hypothetical protein